LEGGFGMGRLSLAVGHRSFLGTRKSGESLTGNLPVKNTTTLAPPGGEGKGLKRASSEKWGRKMCEFKKGEGEFIH